ncbi:potassium voltage-gated channel subfamily H member 2-like [Pollicipes pollicipes]|uniref:potassium voltage-gated channel subfamily H member 2-like n=1 Tax=Pollicipes pollicipes TaxID=41117 RepID=UPI001884E4C5|nr:potassium voltage-gated channel subfamily H member 2-like [Pollicipes pollicipes]
MLPRGLKPGSRFLCIQTIAPVSNEGGELLMFLLNFDDLSSPPEEDDDVEKEFGHILTKFGRARQSFRQSIRSFRKGRGRRTRRPKRKPKLLLGATEQPPESPHITAPAADGGPAAPDVAPPFSRLAVPEEATQPRPLTPASDSAPDLRVHLLDEPPPASPRLSSQRLSETGGDRQYHSSAAELGQLGSMRPASSLDPISLHRVSQRQAPCRSATIGTVYPSEIVSDAQRPRSHTVDNFCQATRNHVRVQQASASSESDLSRYRTLFGQKQSPSISNMAEARLKDPDGSGKHKFEHLNAKNKVAQVGKVVSTLASFGLARGSGLPVPQQTHDIVAETRCPSLLRGPTRKTRVDIGVLLTEVTDSTHAE